MIYLSVMIHCIVRRPSHGPNKYMFYLYMIEGEGWDPVKVA